ncbi:MCP four helix bundle domain-containing protein, partial [Hylemonella gracilis]
MPTFISNLSVAKRVGFGFASILLLFFVTILVSINRLSAVAEATRQMVAVPIKTERLISDWYRNIHTGIRRTGATARSSDPSLVAFFAEDQAASTKSSAEYHKAIEETLEKKRDKDLFNEISELRKAYLSTRDTILALKKEGKVDEANRLLDEKFTPISKVYTGKIQDLLNFQRQDIDDLAKEIQDNYETSRVLLVALTVVSVLFGVVASWLLADSITKPLLKANEVAREVSQGNLSMRIDNSRTDEVGQLLESLKEMQISLARVVSQVREGSESVATASAEIAQGNQDLSARTESQAS